MFVCQRCRVLRWDLAPTPTTKTQHRTLTPPNAASGRQAASHFLHAAGALSRQKGRASGQSRDVCAPACRWAAHATERGPVTPPVAFSALPSHATNCRLRAPATSYTRPAPSRGKRVERAGRESRCPCAPGCSPPICSILCQDGHVLTIKIYLKICGRPSKFADQNLRWPGSKPVLWPSRVLVLVYSHHYTVGCARA